MKEVPTQTQHTMDAYTLSALHGSIRKWEAIVAGTGRDEGVENCPLCQCFLLDNGSCSGCPVAQKVGCGSCDRTPYMDWSTVNPWPKEHPNWRKATTDKHRAAAQKELDFLKSLLPQEAT